MIFSCASLVRRFLAGDVLLHLFHHRHGGAEQLLHRHFLIPQQDGRFPGRGQEQPDRYANLRRLYQEALEEEQNEKV